MKNYDRFIRLPNTAYIIKAKSKYDVIAVKECTLYIQSIHYGHELHCTVTNVERNVIGVLLFRIYKKAQFPVHNAEAACIMQYYTYVFFLISCTIITVYKSN